ncbi:putative membrane protein [Wickerhamomyces ciferrii]|uniref:Membrane protein n=1 Tax=Wickerhamomyces ciferrii (strain ATCC 14091 / BCRC 22168 / CBS 111 / JCM 3599 / NBRC 0793 / NRRL Y-1031 F-60-10) TaxID=1206466 RepID=K0KVW6_WICCF|nr:uncharacterized protein BN7_5229 [Wickerhamomyces ciferrii]CCH45644.1 putative membrane protein [Wickerhamomyces ciferrii]
MLFEDKDIELETNDEPKGSKRLMTPFLSKRIPLIQSDEERTTFPHKRVNFLSRLFFFWLIPLLNRGYKRTLVFNDLWKLDEESSISVVYEKFKEKLNHLTDASTSPTQKLGNWKVLKAIVTVFKWEFSKALLLRASANVFQVIAPLLIKYLIQNVELRIIDSSSPVGPGVGFALGIAANLFFNTICLVHATNNTKTIGAHTNSILTRAILEKSISASSKTRFDFPNGKIVSLMSGDIAKINMGITYSAHLLTLPIPIIVGIALLVSNIGAASLAGISLFIIGVPLLTFPAKWMISVRTSASKYTDERISLLREVLDAMKMIKFYSWEDSYEERIIQVRNKEMSYVFKFQYAINSILSMAVSLPTFSSMLAFLTLYAITPKHNPGNIFSSLALFNVLSGFVTDLPMLISFTSAAFVSLKRISEYLEAPDSTSQIENLVPSDPKIALKVENGSFEWENFRNTNDEDHLFNGLRNITFDVNKGEFVVIMGSIGSGKSSLLSAVSGLMKQTSGEISLDGSLLFCGTPWLQNTTVKENILFGNSFDANRYHNTLRNCALEADLKLLPAGDMTEIGERGVTLSGGQKARINLARAVYANKDIYLLDDVLSAVDANVGKHIVEKCLLEQMSNKTRILATHQLSLVSKADKIIFLNGDGSIDVGTQEELHETNPRYRSMMSYALTKNNKKEKSKSGKDISEQIETNELNSDGKLVEDEQKAIDSIPFRIYVQYYQASRGVFGIFALPFLFLSITLSIFVSLFSSVWLSFWVDDKFNKSNGFYIGMYVGIIILGFIILCVELSGMGYFITEASKTLNLSAVTKILHTPMSFIDKTPMGRILNRFTKDTNSLDNEIGEQLKIFLHLTATIFGILIMCVIYLPWFALALPLLGTIFILTINFYQATSREVKRLEALRRSFVYNNFNEVLSGMETIKCYNSEERFVNKNDRYLDQLNEAYLVTVTNQRWITMVVDTMATAVALIVMLLSLFRVFNISAGSTGLITTSVLNLCESLTSVLLSYSETENEMNSVERLCYYANDLDQEADYHRKDNIPHQSWPQKGAIEFQNISFRYRPELPLVLKNLSVDLKGGEKLGICGRTGAGKSSLMSTLYRLNELSSGKILIDGVDISQLGLHELRSKLTIIPQDPVLFQGTIRRNLDPFNERSDFELWDVLRRCNLIKIDQLNVLTNQSSNNNQSSANKFHLEALVEDGGSNFSLGERQLIALARALVRSTKILIMDEATSSVDYETDALIQNTISNEFKNCTVLCIAHRLKTIVKYDKILVLEKGELEEYDSPLKLFNNNGIFRDMCNSSGISIEDIMEY